MCMCCDSNKKPPETQRLFDEFLYCFNTQSCLWINDLSVILNLILITYIMLKLQVGSMVFSRVWWECFVSMEGKYFLCNYMFFSVIKYCNWLVNFSSAPLIWEFYDSTGTFPRRSCLPISTIADLWQFEDI